MQRILKPALPCSPACGESVAWPSLVQLRVRTTGDCLAIGAARAAGGIYFVLVGFGFAPPPSRINGPQWLATCDGLVFVPAA